VSDRYAPRTDSPTPSADGAPAPLQPAPFTLPGPNGSANGSTNGVAMLDSRSANPDAGSMETDQIRRHRSPGPPKGSAGPDDVAAVAARIAANIGLVIEGKPEVIRLGLTVLLAEGHLLIEDVPGVGKTKFAKALARSIDCSVRRIQFTPDLLPSDVTGVSIYSAERRDFEFKPGAVFANIVVGDEINRASPKTQSALLESMEERQVTVDTTTYELETPFMVLATQNPIDMEGTYPLPEAQLDRFTARMSIGYPDRVAEMAMLAEHGQVDPLDGLKPVSDANEIRAMIYAVRNVYVADAVKAYAVDLANATRSTPEIRLGASPRAVLQLIRTAKAWAAIEHRDYVAPDDVQRMVRPVLAHRLILTPEAQLGRRTTESLLDAIVSRTPVPPGPAPAHGHQR
jgi:MoxR-like ATPase